MDSKKNKKNVWDADCRHAVVPALEYWFVGAWFGRWIPISQATRPQRSLPPDRGRAFL